MNIGVKIVYQILKQIRLITLKTGTSIIKYEEDMESPTSLDELSGVEEMDLCATKLTIKQILFSFIGIATF